MTFTLYTHAGGPNGWKVAIILEELGLKYDSKYLDFKKEEQKAPEFTKFNPNGRIPTLIDHENGDFTLWESMAIIRYLADKYDPENKISFAHGTAEDYLTEQWMAYQASGQGPYFGQAGWFTYFHAEKIPSAIERYMKEVDRVISVLDGVLAKQKYLVGDHITIADLTFYTWNNGAISSLYKDNTFGLDVEKYTNFMRWHKEIQSRPSVQKYLSKKETLQAHAFTSLLWVEKSWVFVLSVMYFTVSSLLVRSASTLLTAGFSFIAAFLLLGWFIALFVFGFKGNHWTSYISDTNINAPNDNREITEEHNIDEEQNAQIHRHGSQESIIVEA